MKLRGQEQLHSFAGIGGGLLYGFFARVAFQWAPPEWLRLVTVGFLFLAPVGIGALTVWLAMRKRRVGWSYAFFAPWVPCFVLSVIVVVFAMDLWICVAMALPVYMIMSSLGGVIVKALRSDRTPEVTETPMMAMLLLLPFLVTPLTSQLVRTEIRTVQEQMMVQADAAKIWAEIIAVPRIQPEEERFAWFVVFGLPRPVEAVLSEEGLGGVRTATYANGIRVIEPVQIWEPNARYGFDVDVDGETIPSPIWWEVQSEYFDVERVVFDLEPAEDGVILHLTTTYRLSTQLNGYAALWVDFLLGDFEQYILGIVKDRAESRM